MFILFMWFPIIFNTYFLFRPLTLNQKKIFLLFTGIKQHIFDDFLTKHPMSCVFLGLFSTQGFTFYVIHVFTAKKMPNPFPPWLGNPYQTAAAMVIFCIFSKIKLFVATAIIVGATWDSVQHMLTDSMTISELKTLLCVEIFCHITT